jgi:SAM-dependent methyltransferase
VHSYDKDLEKWMPRLIAVWRRNRSRGRPAPGPADRLTPQELREVAAGVKKLSHGLTRDRALAGAHYMDDPQLLGAYLLFYWPVSYSQARQALGELPRRPRALLDLGSGPGPVAFAALDAGAAQATCADRSPAALKLARELAAEAEEALATREWDPSHGKLPEGTYDTITAGHVLNELFGTGEGALTRRVKLAEEILGRLNKGGTFLILEPALRDTTRDLLRLRDALVEQGYAVRAPCLFRGPCPALIKDSDWCHAERSWSPPPVLEELARAASLHKESLKMAYLALAPKGEAWPEPPKGRLFRIVSESLEGKGRQRYMGCGPEGRVGLAMQEKHRAPANEAFFHLQRGDVLRVDATEEKGDGFALGPTSQVKVIAPAGKPLPEPWEDA